MVNKVTRIFIGKRHIHRHTQAARETLKVSPVDIANQLLTCHGCKQVRCQFGTFSFGQNVHATFAARRSSRYRGNNQATFRFDSTLRASLNP